MRATALLVLLPCLALVAACTEPTPEELLADATAEYTRAKEGAEKARADLDVREEALAKAQEKRDEAAGRVRKAEQQLADAQAALGLVATDELLFREVQRTLLDDPELRKVAIQATVDGGVVRLTGSVPERDLAERAVAIAEAVPGVAGVESRIVVPAAEGGKAPAPAAKPAPAAAAPAAPAPTAKPAAQTKG